MAERLCGRPTWPPLSPVDRTDKNGPLLRRSQVGKRSKGDARSASPLRDSPWVCLKAGSLAIDAAMSRFPKASSWFAFAWKGGMMSIDLRRGWRLGGSTHARVPYSIALLQRLHALSQVVQQADRLPASSCVVSTPLFEFRALPPLFPGINVMAAHREGCSCSWSGTRRTACSCMSRTFLAPRPAPDGSSFSQVNPAGKHRVVQTLRDVWYGAFATRVLKSPID